METRKAYIAHHYEVDVPLHIGKYELIDMIGTGAFSVVASVRHVISGEVFACKVYSREFMIKNGYYVLFERELRIFQFISHPNIVRFQEVVYGKDLIFVIMEMCKDGDLIDFINTHGPLDEANGVKMFRELLAAVMYLHSRGITHRDLKPENILMNSKTIKVSDFGFAEEMKPNELLTLTCGSEYYVAPEVVSGIPYDGRKCDIWSLGVILYSMQAGFLPWDFSGRSTVFEQGKNSDFDIPIFFSTDLKNLLKQMLDPNPLYRPTCEEIAKHPWCKAVVPPKPAIPNNKNIRRMSMFDLSRKAVCQAIANVKYAKTGTDKFQDILRRPVLGHKKIRKADVDPVSVIHKPAPAAPRSKAVTWTAVGGSPIMALRRSSCPRPVIENI